MTQKRFDLALRGIFVPLLTPFFRGKFDALSLERLLRSTERHVDGFVPCLSSGEGHLISDRVWEQVARATRACTKKPVMLGIKRESMDDVCRLTEKAQRIGCDAVVLPVPDSDEGKTVRFFERVSARSALPIVIYNTEQRHVRTAAALGRLQEIPAVIAIKDSSMNQRFFARACRLRQEGKLRLAVLQGMEHQMLVPKGCDGHLVALANVEPRLCREMWTRNSTELDAKIRELFWKYNLGGNWYVSLKAILFARKVLRSAEEAELAIKPA